MIEDNKIIISFFGEDVNNLPGREWKEPCYKMQTDSL